MAEEFMRNEASFLVPFVDVEEEERAVRRVLSQRNLVVEDVVRGPGFAALWASSFDQKRSAVRIITARGVVAAEDGDLQDLFAPRAVRLLSVAVRAPAPETLLGVQVSAEPGAIGCARFYRVLADGRLAEVEARLDRFGAYACLAGLESDGAGAFRGRVAWPPLSAGVVPSLRVDLKPVTPPLGRPAPDTLTLRVRAAGEWVEGAAQELAEGASAQASFAERQARAVAAAALRILRGESADAQLGAYRQTLGGALPSSPEADVMAHTVDHIEHGWSEAVAEDAAPSGEEGEEPASPAEPRDESIPDDALIIEPER